MRTVNFSIWFCPTSFCVFSEAEINMDSYVVRIYRRDERNPGKVAGLVELIEQEQIKSFTCIEELAKILGLKGEVSAKEQIEEEYRGSTIK
jgi:translation initiation factor 1 (eIF-1/SUI1)